MLVGKDVGVEEMSFREYLERAVSGEVVWVGGEEA